MPTQLHEPACIAGGASARPGLNAGLFAADEVCHAALLRSAQSSVAAGNYGFANCVSLALLRCRSDLVMGCWRGVSWRRHAPL